MNRLQSELHRLYLLGEGLTGPSGDVRALVMELARDADWDVLAKVWRGVQADLQLPAPAIAVSGTDGLQLWFSLQDPVSAPRAAAFLAALSSRYLADVAPARLRLMPSAAAPGDHAALVPAQQQATGNWSAFVAPDLAPIFADTPWLDIQPGTEGQADLLARLESIKPAAFDTALQRLAPAVAESAAQASGTRAAPRPAEPASATMDIDPRRFLQQVLNDETAPLALRIDAAKALLRDGPPVKP